MDGDQKLIIQFYILIFLLTQSWQMINKNLNVPVVSWHEFRAMLPHCGLIFPCQMSEEVPKENENCVCTEYKCIWQKRICVRQRLYVIWAQGLRRAETFVSGCFLSGFVFIYSPLYNLSECVSFPCEREEIETFKEFKMLFFFLCQLLSSM